jgi:hypothetical protein
MFDLHPMEEVEYFGLLFRLRVLCIRLTYDFLRGSFYSYSQKASTKSKILFENELLFG